MSISSPSRAAERLEPRLLLASPSMAEYYPLTPTSHWEYEVTEDGGDTDTLDVRVTRDTRRVNRQEALRVTYSDGDDRVDTFQNYNAKGKLLVHGGGFGDGELFLQPGIKMPGRLKEGYVRRTRGDIDLEYDDFEGDGDYTATVRVGRERQITVPAGTFAAIRVRVDVQFDAEDDVLFGAGPEADGHVTHIMWLARGVGVVRAEQRYEIEADFIIDEVEESGGSLQQLRSYEIAPASKAQQRSRPLVTIDAKDNKPVRQRETPDILR